MLLLDSVVSVGPRVAEVVRGPVGGVDHVSGLEQIRIGEVVCLGPNVFAVEWVELELEPVLGPLPNRLAMGVMFQGVFLLLAAKDTKPSAAGVESTGRAPTTMDGVPDRETNPRSQVLENTFEVVLASGGQQARPTRKLPDRQFLSEVLVHVVCGL